jgi:hypothetical protein
MLATNPLFNGVGPTLVRRNNFRIQILREKFVSKITSLKIISLYQSTEFLTELGS